MAVRTVKARVALDGEKEYKAAIAQLNAGNKTLAAEMKALQAEYKGNADSMEFLTAKGDLLSRMLNQQKAKTEETRKMVEQASQAYEKAAKAYAAAADKDAASQEKAALAMQNADKTLQKYKADLYNAEAAVFDLTHAIRDNDKAIEDLNYNTKGYDDAVKDLYSDLRVVESEMAAGADAAESLQEKDRILNDILAEQAEKLETLKQKMQEMAQSGTATGDEIRELNQQMNEAKIAYNNTTAAINKNREAIEENNEALQHNGEAMVNLGDVADTLGDKFGIKIPADAKKALNGMEGFSAGTVAKMAVAAGAVAAVIKVVKELGELTLQVAAEVDEYLTESMITGVSTEMLQAWDYAAPLIDTDAETIKNAMSKITKAMGDAAAGNDTAIEKFQQLGVSITNEADGSLRSAEEVFFDVVDALGQMEAGTERDAAAMELLGKSAQELNPLINAGSNALKDYAAQAEEVGYILNEDQVKALAAVDDAYQELQLQIEANRKQLAADFAPAAQEAMELFRDVVEKAGRALKESGLIENLATIIKYLIELIGNIGEMISSLPIFDTALAAVKVTLGAIAQFVALIADAADVVSGILNPSNWGSGKARTALGWNYDEGQASRWQTVYMQQNGTYDQYAEYYANKAGTTTKSGMGYGIDPSTGAYGYYDLKTGNFSYNASGNDNWRGGLTWVGEAGPELVSLPAGSQILNAQDSRNVGGDTFYITIDAASVKEFNDIVQMAQNARVRRRMR